ncbi:hypothetical protein EDC01DRAFT_789216 [Geopyxis carbonaria]|nr:hypothetical protein EDC01DRAFT_789216 [Geopyxis carbonaria]
MNEPPPYNATATTTATPAPILPLPPSVRALLRSTLTLTTLHTALLELLQNALDAHATNLTLTLNIAQNSLSLSDNGTGILPSSISSIGVLNSTSKFPPTPHVLGSRGEALAALARHSVLTVTSRARGWRSTHATRWVYGKHVEAGPVAEWKRMLESGTVVRVEGLWGDMPVRVKAREGLDVEREWEAVLRGVVAALVATRAGRGVGVVVRDETGARRMAVRAGAEGVPWELGIVQAWRGAAVTQGWERVRAKQNGVAIEGWIGTRPVLGRRCQFLSINGHPLRDETELHRAVERAFANSAFGAEGDGKGAKKGAERRGAWVLRVECRRDETRMLGGEGGTEGKAGVAGENLRIVGELLQKLVFEFLKAHHFRPLGGVAKPATVPELFRRSNPPSHRSRSRSRTPALADLPERRLSDLSAWSRVKVAKPDAAELKGRLTTKRITNLQVHRPPPASEREGGGEDPDTMLWVNPRTGQPHRIDRRTGNMVMVQAPKRPASAMSPHTSPLATTMTKRPKTSGALPADKTWLQGFLSTWQNPVFPPPPVRTAPIPSACNHTHSASPTTTTHPHTPATSQRLGTLTRAGLAHATVVGQVDHKYILLKTAGHTTTDGERRGAEMVVVVDQHAADERVRVEQLLAALPDKVVLEKPVRFGVDRETRGLVERWRGALKAWGVEVEEARGEDLVITSLPRVAAERDRGGEVAAEWIRAYLHDLDEGRRQPPSTDRDGTREWYTRLHMIPSGLLDTVNSRACRGAVMFNDPLTREECCELIRRLAGCRWPFMCAHGRPSMVPLVEMG